MSFPRTLRWICLGAMVCSITIVVAITTLSLLWPVWVDCRIVDEFLQAVASKESQIVNGEFAKLKELHGTQLGLGRLVDAIKNGDSYSASMVARGLGRIGPNGEAAVSLLIRGLHDNNEFSSRCLVAISEMGPIAKTAVPTLIEIRNGEGNPPHIRMLAARALQRVDPGAEATYWEAMELTALPQPVESGGDISFLGSFRMTTQLPLDILTVKLVRNRGNDGPVIMNSAHATPIEIGEGRWQYTGQLQVRCGPGIYDLVATVFGTKQVGQTSVLVIQSKSDAE